MKITWAEIALVYIVGAVLLIFVHRKYVKATKRWVDRG